MMTKKTSASVALMKKLIILPVLSILVLLFAEVSVAQITNTIEEKQTSPVQMTQKPSKKSGKLTKEDVDYKNGRYFIVSDPVSGSSRPVRRHNVSYAELTEDEKTMISKPFYSERNTPTSKMMSDWKNPEFAGVWIDEKRISNSQLTNFKINDIAHYGTSRILKNATNYGKHKYQVDLMTNDFYDNIYIKSVKKNPRLIIDLRTKK